jgi:hypothetical protein
MKLAIRVLCSFAFAADNVVCSVCTVGEIHTLNANANRALGPWCGKTSCGTHAGHSCSLPGCGGSEQLTPARSNKAGVVCQATSAGPEGHVGSLHHVHKKKSFFFQSCAAPLHKTIGRGSWKTIASI